MRMPFQVLVIPFRRTATGVEFAVLKRSDADWWHFVAGGGEEGETPLDAARRETREEIGITPKGEFMRLDSMATIPRHWFAAAASWPPEVYVVPEHAFAVETGDAELTRALLWASPQPSVPDSRTSLTHLPPELAYSEGGVPKGLFAQLDVVWTASGRRLDCVHCHCLPATEG